MDQHEPPIVVQQLVATWPGQRWTDEAVAVWLFELVSFDLDEALEAVRNLRRTEDFAPSFAKFRDAVFAIRRRKAADRPALNPGEGAALDVTRRIMAMTREHVAKVKHLGEHFHGTRRWPVLDPETSEQMYDDDGEPLYEVTVGVASCPICSGHDHSDTRPFGYTLRRWRGDEPGDDGHYVIAEHKEPVAAWRFTCPVCGNPDAGIFCDTWTPEGAAYRRANPQLFGVEQLIMDDQPQETF